MLNRKIIFGSCCAAGFLMLFTLAGCSRQQNDWQKTRETNTADAYEQFLKKYPSGEFTAQAEARAKELTEERDWQKARDADTAEAYQAFLKQYPEGKWTEEARIRVENFTLAQAPGASGPTAAGIGASAVEPAAAPANLVPGARSAEKAGRPAPAPTPATASLPPAKVAAKPARAADGGSYGIQLGAFKSGPQAANARWEHLKKQYPTLLAGLSSKLAPKKTSDGTLYRLQATGLNEKHAREVCSALQAKSQACVVIAPAGG